MVSTSVQVLTIERIFKEVSALTLKLAYSDYTEVVPVSQTDHIKKTLENKYKTLLFIHFKFNFILLVGGENI